MQISLNFSSKIKLVLILDTLLILLNISNSYSILPYLLFFQYFRAINTIIIFFINSVYLLFRFKGNVKFNVKDNLFILFFIINILNILFGSITKTFGIGMLPFIFANTTFYLLLYNLFNRYIETYSFKKSSWLIIRAFVLLSIINILGILIIYLKINLFDFNPLVNNISEKADLFRTNIKNPNVEYFNPFNIFIIEKTPTIRIPIFQKYGIITGLYHEPHTMSFLVIPAIFLFINKLKSYFQKTVVVSAYIIVMLIAASTTNILGMLICIIVYFFIEYRKHLIIPLLVIFLGFLLISFLDESFYSFIFEKIKSNSASYSLSTIKYAFTPKTLIGTSFFDLSYLNTYWNVADETKNIGFIIFFLNLLFLGLFVFKIFKLNISTSLEKRLIGLFTLYFLFHSMKLAMFSYSLSYLVFVIFALNLYSSKFKMPSRDNTKIIDEIS